MNTIGSYLAHDHARCDALFVPVRAAVQDGQWAQAGRALAEFCHAAERHLLIEERIVFPAYERVLARSPLPPTAASRADHLRIRALMQHLSNALRARDAAAFFEHAATLAAVQCQHSEMEEATLYPMIERVLARSCHDMVGAMRAFGALDALASAA